MKKILSVILIIVVMIFTLTIMSISSNAIEILSREYKIKDNIISYVIPDTSVNSFRSKMKKFDSVQMTIVEGTNTITEGIIKTGMAVIFTDGTDSVAYKVSVAGDVNSDGESNQIDLSSLIRHYIGLSNFQLTEEEKRVSADINGDEDINTIDLSKLIRYIVTNDEKYIENPFKKDEVNKVEDLSVLDYGQYIDLGTNILDKTIQLEDGTTPASDWRVFKKDDDGVWLILADFMPNSAFNVENVGLVPYSTYEVKSPSNRGLLLGGLDSSNWKGLISTNSALYTNSDVIVKGAIDLETWIDSWEDNGYVHINTLKRTGMSATPDWGYYIYQDGEYAQDYTTRLSGDTAGYANALYFPHKSDLGSCGAYWLNSPSSQGAGAIVNVTKYGCLDAQRS
ncbi:MAG: dockerin type I repeat-containing protein [Clostridia bacterium]|nr:dockerin type I repeat-containing protein [Clostridia bacterium]